ncbi:MAG: ribosomal protein S18-alanine N-acetyltransferase [Gammaproteobacteria bacterium]
MSAVFKQPDTRMRPLSLDDLNEIMEIEKRAYEFPWSAGIFSDCLRVGYCCWAYEENNQIIGYGVMSVAAGEAHILNLTVQPDSQRRGIGEKLIKQFVQLAQRYEVDMILLEVRPSNKAAISLYAKLGFNEISVRKAYYPTVNGREDALILACSLAQ